MERNKASVIVIFLLAGFFFIGIAMVFNTSARRSAVLGRQEEVDKKIEFLNSIDLTIYWIGEVPAELEKLKDRITEFLAAEKAQAELNKTLDEAIEKTAKINDFAIITILY